MKALLCTTLGNVSHIDGDIKGLMRCAMLWPQLGDSFSILSYSQRPCNKSSRFSNHKKLNLIKEDKCVKRCSTSYVIRKLQIKTLMTSYYTHTRMAEIQDTDNTTCQRGCGATGAVIHCW